MTAGRKRDAVLRLLRGKPLELVARELAVTAADLSGWRDAFLDGGSASLKSRPRDARDETIDRLRTKVGELTMDTELLQTRIVLEAGGAPFATRRSKRWAASSRSPRNAATVSPGSAGSGASPGQAFTEAAGRRWRRPRRDLAGAGGGDVRRRPR